MFGQWMGDNKIKLTKEQPQKVLDELRKVVRKQDLEISSLKQIHDYDIKMIDDVKGKAIELYNKIDEKDEIIKKQKETIEYLRRSCDRKENKLIEEEQELVELDEKDKIIDLMASEILILDIKRAHNTYDKARIWGTEKGIKQYFRNKVKEVK